MSRAPFLFADRDLPETKPVASNEGPVEVEAVIREERPLAIRVYHRGRLVWLQRAEVRIVARGAGNTVTLSMSRAYRAEKGLA